MPIIMGFIIPIGPIMPGIIPGIMPPIIIGICGIIIWGIIIWGIMPIGIGIGIAAFIMGASWSGAGSGATTRR